MRRVTVAIPVLQGASTLPGVLHALERQRVEADVELLVCDSGSRDGSRELALAAGARVIDILPGGFAHGPARNLLMDRARGDFVALLTQDAEPADEHWLSGLLEGFAAGPDVALVYGPYRPRPDAGWRERTELERFFAALAPDGVARYDRLDAHELIAPASQLLGGRTYFTDANGCVRRSAWKQIPFPPSPYAEDHALSLAMLRAGWAKVFVPSAAVLHSHRYGPLAELRRCFDDWRGLLEVYGWREPASPRHFALQLRGQMGARGRSLRAAGAPAWQSTLAMLPAAAGQSVRVTGAVLGSRADHLPACVRACLSLDGRRSFVPMASLVPGAPAVLAPTRDPPPRDPPHRDPPHRERELTADTPQVCVAVVSFNTREPLARCLTALRADVEAHLVEVVVVDNGSRDGSPEMVTERFPWARLLLPGANLGYGRAVNLAAADSRAPFIAASNADVLATPGALSRMLRAGAEHPGAGAIAPRLVDPTTGATQHSVQPFPTPGRVLAYHLGLTALVPGLGDRQALAGHLRMRPRRVDWAHGALLLVRRSAWEQLGGFDEGHWMYAEDLDLCWRLAHAGWSVRLEPAAVFEHFEAAAAREAFGPRRGLRSRAAIYAWMLRTLGAPRTRLVAAVSVAGCLVRALVALMGACAGRRGAREEARRLLDHARVHLVGLYPRRALEAFGTRGAFGDACLSAPRRGAEHPAR